MIDVVVEVGEVVNGEIWDVGRSSCFNAKGLANGGEHPGARRDTTEAKRLLPKNKRALAARFRVSAV